MNRKHDFAGIIITVVIAVILMSIIPIYNNMTSECPPCEECEECPPCDDITNYNIGNISVSPDFASGDYTVDKGSFDYLDDVTIIKDENLKPENIKNGVNIFGVIGTLESSELPYLTIKIDGGFGSYHQRRVPSIQINDEELFNGDFVLDVFNGTFQIVFSSKTTLDDLYITSIYVGEQRTSGTAQDEYGYIIINGNTHNFNSTVVGFTVDLSNLLPSGNIIEITTSYKMMA